MRGEVGEPGVGVAGGAGGEVERVEGVEHVVAVLVGFFAGRQEVEAGLFRGGAGDGVVCVSGFGFEGWGRALEDGAEEFAGGVGGGWFGFFGGGVDVAGDECVFHDCVSNLGW